MSEKIPYMAQFHWPGLQDQLADVVILATE
jgi:hypothetical protein